MTVAELIAKLQEMPPDMPVWTESDGLYYEVEDARKVLMERQERQEGLKYSDEYVGPVNFEDRLRGLRFDAFLID